MRILFPRKPNEEDVRILTLLFGSDIIITTYRPDETNPFDVVEFITAEPQTLVFSNFPPHAATAANGGHRFAVVHHNRRGLASILRYNNQGSCIEQLWPRQRKAELSNVLATH